MQRNIISRAGPVVVFKGEDCRTDREENKSEKSDTDTDQSEDEDQVYDDNLQPVETVYVENVAEELGQVGALSTVALRYSRTLITNPDTTELLYNERPLISIRRNLYNESWFNEIPI